MVEVPHLSHFEGGKILTLSHVYLGILINLILRLLQFPPDKTPSSSYSATMFSTGS